MVDYVKLATTALRLVTENGKLISFVRFEETPANPAEPWKGAADPRDPADEQKDDVPAVFVEPSSAQRLGISSTTSDLIKRSEQIAIVALGPDDQTNLADFDEVIDDDGTRWKIMGVEQLKPATVSLLFYVGLKR